MLIDEEGSAKVTDFGIARTLDEEGLTADGRVLGTTDYVSPEQALGQPVTGQSDLYSLGVVLYEMLTGEVPFKGENQVAVAMKHVREELPDVQVKRPEVSAALAAVVDTATAKRQQDRYADDAELIADLEDVLAIETARAGSADRRGDERAADAAVADAQRRVPFRVRHRASAVLLVLVVLAAAVGLVVWLGTQRAPRHRQAPGEGAELVPVVGPAVAGQAVLGLRVRLQPAGSADRRTSRRGAGDRQPAQHGLDHADLLRRHAQQGGRRPVHRRQAQDHRPGPADHHDHPRLHRDGLRAQ